jgi:hypothetical protein
MKKYSAIFFHFSHKPVRTEVKRACLCFAESMVSLEAAWVGPSRATDLLRGNPNVMRVSTTMFFARYRSVDAVQRFA